LLVHLVHHYCSSKGYTESDERPSGKLARIPPAPTAISSGEEKALQNDSFPGGRSAGGIDVAVGIHPMAIDNSLQYRPKESPAKSNIQDRAVDAGGSQCTVILCTIPYLDFRELTFCAPALRRRYECTILSHP
jgi:hypothetical protein